MNILVINAHPDDEVLGMGGTILKHAKKGDKVSVAYLTTGITSRRSTNYKTNSKYEIENLITVGGESRSIEYPGPSVNQALSAIHKNHNFEHFSDFALYGRWGALIVGKRLPQGPLTISTPGKPNSDNFFVGTCWADLNLRSG